MNAERKGDVDHVLGRRADDVESAFQFLREGLTKHYLEPAAPLPEAVRVEPDI